MGEKIIKLILKSNNIVLTEWHKKKHTAFVC